MRICKTILDIGDTFGRLTVLGDAPKMNKHRAYRVRCQCGVEKIVRAQDLKSGGTRSCGCASPRRNGIDPANRGLSRDPVYSHWNHMKARCRRPDAALRGYTIIGEWMSFPMFRAWAMENGFVPGLTIDRRANALGYHPANCRWIDKTGQNRNRDMCLTEGAVRSLRIRAYYSNDTLGQIGADVGVSPTSVMRVIRGTTWSDIGPILGRPFKGRPPKALPMLPAVAAILAAYADAA